MPAISVAGAAFTVFVASVAYTDQITSGTVTTTPTIVRTKTLSSVAFDQTDLNSTMSLEFLYDENTGLFDALQVAIAAATPVAVVVSSALGSWTSASACRSNQRKLRLPLTVSPRARQLSQAQSYLLKPYNTRER
jgi:hypothetical protein